MDPNSRRPPGPIVFGPLICGGAARPDMRGEGEGTRLKHTHTEISTLSLHDALPILSLSCKGNGSQFPAPTRPDRFRASHLWRRCAPRHERRGGGDTSETHAHRDLHSFPTRRSSDLIIELQGEWIPIPGAHQARSFSGLSFVAALRATK